MYLWFPFVSFCSFCFLGHHSLPVALAWALVAEPLLTTAHATAVPAAIAVMRLHWSAWHMCGLDSRRVRHSSTPSVEQPMGLELNKSIKDPYGAPS